MDQFILLPETPHHLARHLHALLELLLVLLHFQVQFNYLFCRVLLGDGCSLVQETLAAGATEIVEELVEELELLGILLCA